MPKPEDFMSPAEREALEQTKNAQDTAQPTVQQPSAPVAPGGLTVTVPLEDRVRELELMITMFNQMGAKYTNELQMIRQQVAQRQPNA